MRTIALINQKGGVGKTTVALHLATAFHQAGAVTLILDLDPQASASEWHDAREAELPHVESIQPARLSKAISTAQEIGTEVLILDTAPHAESTALEAARLADLVLLRLVQVSAFAVLNSVSSSGTVADEAAEMIEGNLSLPVCPVRLGDRVAYNRSLITGQTALEFEPHGKAAREIEQLHMWVCEQMSMPAGEPVLMSA
jgi:chromosome partitioning protein